MTVDSTALGAASEAEVPRPYLTLRDDGAVAASPIGSGLFLEALRLYRAQNLPVPEVLSVWTNFSFTKDYKLTLFLPLGNSVSGIGLPASPFTEPPLRGILFHNDVMHLADRARFQGAPVDGYAEYLFLLELSHVWGPALQVPGGPDRLLGYPYHWSFFLDAGGSPAGGNRWKDNGDGTFTVMNQLPGGVAFTPLDLYAMGLIPASEVLPFGLLENASVVAPQGAMDPYTGRSPTKTTLPWFRTEPLRVQATRKVFTIDDVIASSGGARAPAAGQEPTTLKIAFVLIVKSDATDADIAAAQAVFDPLAAAFAPAFARATGHRASLDVLTQPRAGGNSDGGAPDLLPDVAPTPPTPPPSRSGGCSSAPGAAGRRDSLAIVGLLGLIAAARGRRRLRHSFWPRSGAHSSESVHFDVR